MVMRNRIFKARTQGIGSYTLDEAIEWGVTGPGLRACGLEWDFRKTAALLRLRAVRVRDSHRHAAATATTGPWCASRRCARACGSSSSVCDNMPAGPYKADHPLATPPRKERTMHDIETLITHFLGVSWGPVIPPGRRSSASRPPRAATATT